MTWAGLPNGDASCAVSAAQVGVMRPYIILPFLLCARTRAMTFAPWRTGSADG